MEQQLYKVIDRKQIEIYFAFVNENGSVLLTKNENFKERDWKRCPEKDLVRGK